MAHGRTIHLHIGTEKTGTTTLQAMLSVNRAVLAASGILYPVTPGKMNHVGLSIFALHPAHRPGLNAIMQLNSPSQVQNYVDNFVSSFTQELKASPCPNIILSNEHLSSRVRQRPALDKIITLLQSLSDNIKVIVYLRPQFELAPSSYSTTVKSGGTKPFRPPASAEDYFYNYDLLTRNWGWRVGRENVVPRIFSRRSFKNGSLVEDMFAAMGLQLPQGLVIPEDKNKALGAYAVEFLRIANGVVPRLVGGRLDPAHQKLVRALSEVASAPKFNLHHSTLVELERMFEASNRAVAERYFPELNGRLFEPLAPTTVPVKTPTVENIVDVGVALWKAQQQRPRFGKKTA